MYAIIKSGGKQYRVVKGDVVDVELLGLDQGAQVEFNVLFVHNGDQAFIGEPSVEGYVVRGEVIGASAGPKVTSLKYKARQHQQKKWGHRQHYTRVKIVDIEASEKPAEAKAS